MNREAMESLGDRIAEHAAHLDAATHRLLADIREFDQEGGWFLQGARSCAQWLAWRVGWDNGTAREHVRVANQLADLPLIDEALRLGKVSYSKARAMTRVATSKNEETLLEEACNSTGAQLEAICRKYRTVQRHDQDVKPADDKERRYVSRRDTADGMVCIEAMLHPEEAAIIWAALDRMAVERCRTTNAGATATATPVAAQAAGPDESGSEGVPAETPASVSSPTSDVVGEPVAPMAPQNKLESIVQPDRPDPSFSRADALLAIAEEVVRGTRKDRSPIELSVVIAAETLYERRTTARAPSDPTAAPSDPSRIACFNDGTCISATAARRLACDCGVVEIVEDDHGNPLSVGRRTRTIPGALKRAVLCRDKTCRFPGCTTRVFLQSHHLEHWADGGETKLANLLSLCSYHHRYLHEYGYTIKTAADGEPQFFDERGHEVRNIPEPIRCPALGWPSIHARNVELEISCDTPVCGWDGLPVDYHLAIDALVRADA